MRCFASTFATKIKKLQQWPFAVAIFVAHHPGDLPDEVGGDGALSLVEDRERRLQVLLDGPFQNTKKGPTP